MRTGIASIAAGDNVLRQTVWAKEGATRRPRAVAGKRPEGWRGLSESIMALRPRSGVRILSVRIHSAEQLGQHRRVVVRSVACRVDDRERTASRSAPELVDAL